MNVTELSSHPKYQDYAGYKLRDEWLDTVATIDMPARAYRVAIKLYLAFNCKTGRCDPLYETMAGEMGASKRTVERGVGDLEAAGLIEEGSRGIRRDFVLKTPSEVATPAVAGGCDNSCRNTKPKKPAKVATDIGGSCDSSCPKVATPAVAQNTVEHWNTDKSGASAPRSVPVDSQSPVTEETTDNISAPYGADANHVERGDLDMSAPTINGAPGEPLVNPGCTPAAAAELEALAQQIDAAGGFGPGTQHMADHLRGAERQFVARRSFAIRRERRAAKQAERKAEVAA